MVKQKAGLEAAKKINVYNEDFDQVFSDGFLVEIYGYFTEIKDCVGFELIKHLGVICRQNKLPMFKAFLRFSNGDQCFDVERLNDRCSEQFVEKVLNEGPTERIYVCGPPQFNKDVPEFALNHGLTKDKIILI